MEAIKNSKQPPKALRKRRPKRNIPHLRKRKLPEDDESDIAVKAPLYSESSESEEDLLFPKPYPMNLRINYNGEYGLNEPEDPYLQPANLPLYNERELGAGIPQQNPQNHQVEDQPEQEMEDGDVQPGDDTMTDDNASDDDDHENTVIQRPPAQPTPKVEKKVNFDDSYFQRTYTEHNQPEGVLKRAWNYVAGNKSSETYAEKAKKASQTTPRPIISSTPKESGNNQHPSPGYSPIAKPAAKPKHLDSTPKRSDVNIKKRSMNWESPKDGSPSGGSPKVQGSPNRTRLFARSPNHYSFTMRPPQIPEDPDTTVSDEPTFTSNDEPAETGRKSDDWQTVTRKTRSKGKVEEYPNVMSKPLEYKRRKGKKH